MNRHTLIGFVSCLLLMACAGATFPYKYYTLSPEVDFSKGKLLRVDPKDDIFFSECAPTQSDLAPCTVFKTSEFLRLRQEYKDLVNKLQACERYGQPQP